MKNFILEFIDWFIPAELGEYDQSEEYLRARVLVATLIISIGSTVAMYVTALIFTNYTNHSVFIGGAFSMLCLILMVLCLNFFKYTGSFLITGNLLGATLFFGTVGSGMVTGGHAESPTMSLAFIVPALVSVISGTASGIVWSILCMFLYLGFFLAYTNGIEITQTLTPDQIPHYQLIMHLVTLGFISLSFYVQTVLQHHMAKRFYKEQSKLAYVAAHDPLTGIPNRTTFEKTLELCIDRVILNDTESSVTILEITNLADITETHGHDMMDDVLRITARRLSKNLRGSDSAAKLSDCQFAVIWTDTSSKDPIEKMVKQLHDILEQKVQSFDIQVQLNFISGTVSCPLHGDDTISLCMEAQKAIERGKEKQQAITIKN